MKRIGIGLIIPFAILVGWEILSRTGCLPPNWVPSPWTIVEVFREMLRDGELFGHIFITLYRVLTGFAIGVAVATVCGSLIGYSPRLRELLAPLLQAWDRGSIKDYADRGWRFFPVYLNLMNGILHVDPKLIEVGRVFRLNGFQLVRRVILLATLPAYLVGLRSGLGLGWMFVVAAEIMGASKGIGFLMTDGQATGRPAIIMASILLFAVLGKLTDFIVERTGCLLIKGNPIQSR